MSEPFGSARVNTGSRRLVQHRQDTTVRLRAIYGLRSWTFTILQSSQSGLGKTDSPLADRGLVYPKRFGDSSGCLSICSAKNYASAHGQSLFRCRCTNPPFKGRAVFNAKYNSGGYATYATIILYNAKVRT
jgi:hypothetical protein